MSYQNSEAIPIITEARLKLGLERLINSPLDLRRCGARVWDQDMNSDKSHHWSLFNSYVHELREVIPEARKVWRAIIIDCQSRNDNIEKAMLEALRFQPAGAAFDGRVIAVVRKYWLACDALNSKLQTNQKVSPHIFLLSWLIDAGYSDAAEVLAGMPYWPIGLDRDGNWV